MRDRPARRRALAALLVVGTGGSVEAFSPSRAHTRCAHFSAMDEQGRLGCNPRDRRQPSVALGAARTKRTRSTEPTATETTDASTHSDRPAKPPRIKFELLPDFMQKDPLLVTKQTWLEKTNPPTIEEGNGKRKDMEMMAMSAATIALSVGVIYVLASSAPDMVELREEGGSEGVVNLLREGNIERFEFATRNIVGTVLPQSAEDVIAVSIGEGIAGVIGALATWVLGIVLNFNKSEMGFVVTPVNEAMEMEGAGAMDALVSEAVADGDYFLTRAAAQPLLEAFGLPVFLASFASVLIATLPYEAVKLTSRKRQQAVQEEMLLEQLLEEEEKRRGEMNVVDEVSNRAFNFFQQLYVRGDSDDEDWFDDEEDELEALRKEQLANVPEIDYIELFADISKWLEYDVLITNYRGILALPNGQMLSTGWESAIFGLLAALSSQLYTDVLYLYSDFGNPEKREATINRSLEGWASVYATRCLGAATLFGTYEAVRAPTSRLLARLVSGGIGGCVGSEDYDLCVETYLIDNPPGAAFGADFRAAAVSAASWFDSLPWLLPLDDGETAGAFFRGAAVSLNSVLAKFFDMVPAG